MNWIPRKPTESLPTIQQVFDKCAAHLLTQGQRSVREWRGPYHKASAYRGDNGLRCPVGCLIDDDYYDEEMEGLRVSHWIVLAGLRQSHVLPDYDSEGDPPEAKIVISLLGYMQRMHDSVEPCGWRDELYAIADNFRLSPAVIDKYSATRC